MCRVMLFLTLSGVGANPKPEAPNLLPTFSGRDHGTLRGHDLVFFLPGPYKTYVIIRRTPTPCNSDITTISEST